jgi:hypothetical protein
MAEVRALSVVWLDSVEGRLFHISDEQLTRETVFGRIRGLTPLQLREELAQRLAGAPRILVVGSDSAGTAFITHLSDEYPALARRVVGRETADRPSDGELAAYALKYLRK